MPIQDADLFLIEDTSGVSKKITASKLKANLAANTYNNHKLLVNKPDYTSKFVYAQNMQQSVSPTDYMMVERAGVSYKVNGQQIIDYFPSAPAGTAGPIVNVSVGTGGVSTITPTPSPNIFQDPPAIDDSWTGGDVLNLTDLSTTYTFSPAWDMQGTAWTRGGAYGGGDLITYIFTDINGVVQSIGFPTPASYSGNFDISSIDFSVPIVSITITVARTPGYQWGFYKSNDSEAVKYPDLAVASLLQLGSSANLDIFTPGDAVTMVDSDGAVATYTPITSAITNVSGNTLAFASPNQDLKFFNVGDEIGQNQTVVSTDTIANSMVVSGGDWIDSSASSSSGTWLDGASSSGDIPFSGDGGWAKMFNGVVSSSPTSADFTTVPRGPTFSSLLTFNPPITSVSKVQFWGGMEDSNTGGYPSYTYLIDGNGTEHDSNLPVYRKGINPPYAGPGSEITPVNGIVAIKVVSAGNSGYIGGVYFDDELAVWLGASKVTGLPKSGAGNFDSSNEAEVKVVNTNFQWISNDNRLSEEFFIKPASTRTGLAILRTKAIEAATAIAQAKEDIRDGDFAIVDDNYWFRDEDTFIDLGPINLTSK